MKTQNICLSWCTKQLLRALALGNANAKYKGYLVFQVPKCIASGDAIAKYCKFYCISLSIHHYRINYSDWGNIILLCKYIILISRIGK